MNDYFSGFKVAKYQLTEEEKIKEQQEAEKWAENMDSGNVDQEYWDKLLRNHYEQHVEEESGKMGKGTFFVSGWATILRGNSLQSRARNFRTRNFPSF